ncbi:MAG: endolytic transglycosylase MltG [Bryobacteraceae bacterium]
MKRALAAALLVFVCAALAALWSVRTAYRSFEGNLLVEIPRGSGTRAIAQLLTQKGVLRDPWGFLVLRAIRPSARLQAGEYEFREPSSAWEVFDRLARGDVHYYLVTIPEGSNLFDAARIVGKLGFITEEGFRAAASDPVLIRDLDPAAKTLEGYLFPSTYRLTRSSTAAQLCRNMTEQFRQVWKKLGGSNANETVTLASLVEKETGEGDERAVVAGVFRNRLEQGIKLECDPTTIYAALLEDRYRGKIYRSDLDSEHPYNTYQHTGLPPGPIANPGQASLAAALHPAKTDFLYFVAKPGSAGGHNFSRTLSEHSRAVAAYRNGQNHQAPSTGAAPRAGATAAHR